MVDRSQTYIYRGDRWTAPELRGGTVFAVKALNTWGRRVPAGQGPVCVRGRNGNMLVETADGVRHVVLGRLLRKLLPEESVPAGRCRLATQSGNPCTRRATKNGFCLQHGGVVTPRRGRFCVRCATRRGELHIHHVIARIDGGTDDPENLEFLCIPCHEEWHQRFQGSLGFAEYVELPPMWFFAYVWTKQESDVWTVEQLRDIWWLEKARRIAAAGAID